MPQHATHSQEDPSLMLHGQKIGGRYAIERRIAFGSYAEIYLARDLQAAAAQPDEVIVKALNPRLKGMVWPELEETLRDLFRGEAEALDRLRDVRGVVGFYGSGRDRDQQGRDFDYLVIEYLSGGTIGAVGKGKAAALDQSLQWMSQICATVALIHKRGILHRDLKPDNLLLTADHRTVKLTDFGVARLDRLAGAVTQVGTDIYAAPEHFLRADQTTQLTQAADVYSLAKAFYFILSGEAPAPFAQQRISSLPKSVSGEAWAAPGLNVLRRATEPHAGDRYQTATDFWCQLQQAILRGAQASDASHRSQSSDRSRIVIGLREPDEERQGVDDQTVVKPVTAVVRVVADCAAEERAQRGDQKDHRLSKWRAAIALLPTLLLVLALLAGAWRIIREQQKPQVVSPATNIQVMGREGVMTRDAQLRIDASTRFKPVGEVARNSRVRVLEVSRPWYRVEVINHAKPKTNSRFLDQGWIRMEDMTLDRE